MNPASLPTSTPSAPHALRTHQPTLWQLPVYAPNGAVSRLWQMAKEHVEKVGPICGPGRDHKFEL